MSPKRGSDGLGGFSGISSTLLLGSRKHITFHNTHLLVLCLLLTTTHKTHTIACFSLILDLQHSNEFYRNIKHPGCRVQSHIKNVLFTKQLILLLSLIIFTSWSIHLILLCGDIELNPGPNSVESLTDLLIVSLTI